MKKFLTAVFLLFCAGIMFAQNDDELFGSDDDLFFGDDDGIIEMEEIAAPKTDLKNGVIFETGSVKIGGNFNLSLGTTTVFNDGDNFKDSVKETALSPTAEAMLTIDARPAENLRMYMKTGIAYPFVTKGNSPLNTITIPSTLLPPEIQAVLGNNGAYVYFTSDNSPRNLFYVKELFTDFNIGENVAMRFGKQTVTWGVGYFYSPADVINSAIDPENPTEQVEGPLCLRSQIVFPGTQNALWAYLIPDNNFLSGTVKARDTALALKGEFVFGGWEIGIGAYYQYDTTPRFMTTASGTIFKKLSVFGEGVCAYGQPEAWLNNEDKKFYGQGTLGFMYNWSDPKITLMGQYYFNGQDDSSLLDLLVDKGQLSMDDTRLARKKGHNCACAVSFGKIGTTSVTGSVYAIANFTNEVLIASGSLSYKPINELSISAGPYVTWTGFDNKPVAAVKLDFSLGGGKF